MGRVKTYIGKVLKSFIEDEVREISMEIYEDYTFDSRQILPPGIDANPIESDQGVSITLDNSDGKTVQIGVIPDPEVEPGEFKIFSRLVDGTKKAILYLKKDGIIDINGDTDNAVRFSELKKVIDEIQGDISDLKTVFSTGWVVLAQDGGAALKTAAGTWAGTALAENIDDSKVDEVLLPELPTP